MKPKLFLLLLLIGIALAGCDHGTNPAPEQTKSYIVTFDTDGGSAAPSPITVQDGKTAGTLPTAPTKDDFNFAGWWTQKDGGGSQFTDATPVTADITVYAKWTALPVYTVTFDSDGGTSSTSTKSVEEGKTVDSLPINPTKNGYAFEGWFTDKNGGGSQFDGTTVVTADITVYAKRVPLYTVTFDSDGGQPDTTLLTIEEGHVIGSLPDAPVKTGYTFSGWFTDKNGAGDQVTDTTVITGSITVYANWTINQYTVTFDSQGGSPVPPITIDYNTTIGDSFPFAPTYDGHLFGGWWTETNGGGTQFVDSTPVTDNITVSAYWEDTTAGFAITGVPIGTFAIYLLSSNPTTADEFYSDITDNYLDDIIAFSFIINQIPIDSTHWYIPTSTQDTLIGSPSDGTYTMVLLNFSNSVVTKANNVTITNGCGIVSYDSFVVLPSTTNLKITIPGFLNNMILKTTNTRR